MTRSLHRPASIALLVVATGFGFGAVLAAEPARTAPPATAGSRVTVAKDNLWAIARKVQQGPGLSRQQVMVAILRANPTAFEGGNMHRLRRGVTLTIPPMAVAAQEDRAEAARLVDAHRDRLGTGERLADLPVTADRAASAAAEKPASAAQMESPAASAATTVPAAPPISASAPAATSAPETTTEPAAASTRMNGRAADGAAPAPLGQAATGERFGWLPVAAGLALAGAAWWIWRRPRREAIVDAGDLPSTFLDEDGVQRRRRPKITEVSQAAAEMARTVEALQQTQLLVRRGDETATAQATHAMDTETHAGVQLELARALIAIGRPGDARLHLGSVLRQGSSTQKLDAQDLAAQIG